MSNQSYGFVLGQVLSRRNIEDVIKFAKRQKLFILADEVLCLVFCRRVGLLKYTTIGHKCL